MGSITIHSFYFTPRKILNFSTSQLKNIRKDQDSRTCVDLPEPVSAAIMVTRDWLTASVITFL